MIFISYRRIDTQAWASHLYDELRRRFGDERVFMDIRGGIRGGEPFAQVLQQRLQDCKVLLALIGPQWTSCQRQDGRPRLQVDDDWVRREVATALQRGILVVPVLFGRGALPAMEELPADLHALLGRNHRPVRDESWEHDVNELETDFGPLVARDDIGQAGAGLAGLRRLMLAQRAVADAVRDSRQTIDEVHRQIARLEAFKTVHDELHEIEFGCLRPLQESGPETTRVRPFRNRLEVAAANIRRCLAGGHVATALADEVEDYLGIAADALQAAVASPAPATLARAVAELTRLVSRLPPQLDENIALAAADLNLADLSALMSAVLPRLPAATQDAELAPIVQGVAALQRQGDELRWRVAEHTQLQRLNAKLLQVCNGHTEGAELAAEWARVRRMRARLPEAPSDPLRLALEDLAEDEADIEARLGEPAALPPLLRRYLVDVARVFRDVDAELRRFCLRLSDLGQQLRTVLDMV